MMLLRNAPIITSYSRRQSSAHWGEPGRLARRNKGEHGAWITVTSDDYETERRRMAAKMRAKEGKEEYKMHKETVEWPFGRNG